MPSELHEVTEHEMPEGSDEIPFVVQVEGSTVTVSSADVHAAGGHAIMMLGDRQVGEIFVERLADAPDGTPQFSTAMLYEFDPNEWDGDPEEEKPELPRPVRVAIGRLQSFKDFMYLVDIVTDDDAARIIQGYACVNNIQREPGYFRVHLDARYTTTYELAQTTYNWFAWMIDQDFGNDTKPEPEVPGIIQLPLIPTEEGEDDDPK